MLCGQVQGVGADTAGPRKVANEFPGGWIELSHTSHPNTKGAGSQRPLSLGDRASRELRDDSLTK
jgi:hypothetical protein